MQFRCCDYMVSVVVYTAVSFLCKYFKCHSDFVLIFPHSKKPKRPQRQRQQNNRLKPLTLAYDGDTDMQSSGRRFTEHFTCHRDPLHHAITVRDTDVCSVNGHVTERRNYRKASYSRDTGGVLPFQVGLHSLPSFLFFLSISFARAFVTSAVFNEMPFFFLPLTRPRYFKENIQMQERVWMQKTDPALSLVSEHGSTSSNSSPALFRLSLKMLSSWRLRML